MRYGIDPRRHRYRGYVYTITRPGPGYLYFVRVHDNVGIVNLGASRTVHTARKKAERYIRSIGTGARATNPVSAIWGKYRRR